ncbi:GNAT family N-acetyltransferase [Chondromyces crocatus]|uniref:N-acetyltransferase GCN5 n=1 Tax=Chondromyces crocatus TaxID=52 RepID=A0A0K1EMU0_CHOCO|nr:GNAT family N-acetyltransferase [Chondromyces crocatus]AKT41972.1 N-acetyltransferase GCN5 [Chondromyces crocatus]
MEAPPNDPLPPLPPDAALHVRDARDDDAEGLITLMGRVFSEYPGCILDVDGEMPELRAIASAFQQRRGRFWVVESEGRVVGCVGCRPASDPAGVELCKLYVSSSARRRGLGSSLCALVELEARARGAAFVELWSDTRFLDAHRLYERLGYVRGTETRELHDKSDTVEFFFRRPLRAADAS